MPRLPACPPPAGGLDNEVKVWDTNSLQVVCGFAIGSRVYAAAMSAVATSHCLVAVGSGDTQVGMTHPPCRVAGLAAWLVAAMGRGLYCRNFLPLCL